MLNHRNLAALYRILVKTEPLFGGPQAYEVMRMEKERSSRSKSSMSCHSSMVLLGLVLVAASYLTVFNVVKIIYSILHVLVYKRIICETYVE